MSKYFDIDLFSNKDRVQLLAMVTNGHFAVSDSHALLAQHVVERGPAEL
jgi:hypothetical protein